MCDRVCVCACVPRVLSQLSGVRNNRVSDFMIHMPFAFADNIVTGGGNSGVAIGWVRQYPQLCCL